MTYRKDPGVDAYFASLPEWQQAVCQQVRDLLHEADAEVIETPKYRGRPYFALQGNIAALMGTKDHVNVFLYDPLVSDPEAIITGGRDNQTGRQIAIYEGNPINRRALSAMFRQIIANNRAGGWRKIKRAKP